MSAIYELTGITYIDKLIWSYVPCESEEDEEFLEEHEKIARDGLNNFMSKTSVFDKLYNKVMVNENFGEDQEDITDIEALGIETDEGGDDGDVTITISKECAQELHDKIMAVLGDDEPDEDFEVRLQGLPHVLPQVA